MTIREQAAVLCAIAASAPYGFGSIAYAAECIHCSLAARSLALRAWDAAHKRGATHKHAEAEALIRTGWNG